MKAGCAAQKLQFEAHGKRDVVAYCDGGRMTSDGGGLLLREANCCLGDLMARLGQCVSDFRQQGSVEHTVTDLTGQGRKRKRDRAAPLASAATLKRFELGRPETAPSIATTGCWWTGTASTTCCRSRWQWFRSVTGVGWRCLRGAGRGSRPSSSNALQCSRVISLSIGMP